MKNEKIKQGGKSIRKKKMKQPRRDKKKYIKSKIE